MPGFRAEMTARYGIVAQAAVVAVFLIFLAVQWHGPGFFVGTDAIAYIVGGVNLITTGRFTNLAGQPELWFPPFYPITIGLVSLGGRVNPETVSHVIAATCAVIGLLLTARCARLAGARGYEAVLAMAVLALNPIHQNAGLYALSESTATVLALLAFMMWLPQSGRSFAHYALVGLFVGFTYLTRPEGIVLLPFWATVDAIRSKFSLAVLKRCAVAGLVAALVALPYVSYLYRHTGRVALTGKTAINLTSGRATYYGQPTEFIDPGTLEVGLWKYDVSFAGEAGRFLWNEARVAGSYARHLIGILGVAILVGVVSFARAREGRFLAGGAVFVAYLVILGVFQMKDRFLHMSLPFLSILAARGLTSLLQPVSRVGDAVRRAPLRVALAAAMGIGAVAQSIAAASDNIEDGTGGPLLAKAGAALRSTTTTKGVVYDQWGQVAFNSNQFSRILTPNDTQTILRYIDRHAVPGQPVYLALSSMEASWYHPSLRPLIESAEGFPQLRRVVAMSDKYGSIVIYEVRPLNAPVR